MLDTHCFYFLYYFAWSAAAVDVGVQESKMPGTFYDVQIPDGQVQLGGSQAGGLACSIRSSNVIVLAFSKAKLD